MKKRNDDLRLECVNWDEELAERGLSAKVRNVWSLVEQGGGATAYLTNGIGDGTTVKLTITDDEGSASVDATWLDIG